MIIWNCEQGSPEWIAAKVGVLSASRMGKLLTPKQGRLSSQADGLIDELIAEQLIGEPYDETSSVFMERGKECEPQARAWYEWTRDVTVRQVGFIFLDERGEIGCSPDGLVGEDGGIEIKILGAKNHVHTMRYPSDLYDEYRHQVQAALWITQRDWWDLVAWHPTMRSVVQRILPDETYIEQLSAACESVVEQVRLIVSAETPPDK